MDFVAPRDAVRAPAPVKIPDEALDEVAMAVSDAPASDDEHLPEADPGLAPEGDAEKRA